MSDDALGALRVLDERRRHLVGSRRPRHSSRAPRADAGRSSVPLVSSRKRHQDHAADDAPAEFGQGARQNKRQRGVTNTSVLRAGRGGHGGRGARGGRGGRGGRRGSGGANDKEVMMQEQKAKKSEQHEDDRPRASVPAVVQGRNRRMFGALLGHLRSAKESTESDQRRIHKQDTRMDIVTRRNEEEGGRLREIEAKKYELEMGLVTAERDVLVLERTQSTWRKQHNALSEFLWTNMSGNENSNTHASSLAGTRTRARPTLSIAFVPAKDNDAVVELRERQAEMHKLELQRCEEEHTKAVEDARNKVAELQRQLKEIAPDSASAAEDDETKKVDDEKKSHRGRRHGTDDDDVREDNVDVVAKDVIDVVSKGEFDVVAQDDIDVVAEEDVDEEMHDDVDRDEQNKMMTESVLETTPAATPTLATKEPQVSANNSTYDLKQNKQSEPDDATMDVDEKEKSSRGRRGANKDDDDDDDDDDDVDYENNEEEDADDAVAEMNEDMQQNNKKDSSVLRETPAAPPSAVESNKSKSVDQTEVNEDTTMNDDTASKNRRSRCSNDNNKDEHDGANEDDDDADDMKQTKEKTPIVLNTTPSTAAGEETPGHSDDAASVENEKVNEDVIVKVDEPKKHSRGRRGKDKDTKSEGESESETETNDDVEQQKKKASSAASVSKEEEKEAVVESDNDESEVNNGEAKGKGKRKAKAKGKSKKKSESDDAESAKTPARKKRADKEEATPVRKSARRSTRKKK